MDAKIKPADVWLNKNSLIFKMPLLLIALGAVSLFYWFSFYSTVPSRAMYGYLFGFAEALSLVLGCMIFVLIQHVTRAGWSVVIRRIPEAFMATSPLLILFFLPIAFFSHEIFPWLHEKHVDKILAKKLPYLNENFFLIRSFIYLFIWGTIGIWFYRLSVKQDKNGELKITRILQAISAPCIIVFGLSLTFASFDWFMSLQPHWYSTMFGVYFFAGSFLSSLALITISAIFIRKSQALTTVITKEHYHDLGKLLFGFTVFWAYIGFSQFMLYWYAAIPEEAEFYIHRMHHGFGKISWALPIIHFFIPFFALMPRTLKKIPLILALNCLWLILVHIIDLYWLILPTYRDAHGHALELPNGILIDFLALFGINSIFIGVFIFILSRRCLLPIKDPRLPESLAFENF